MIPALNERHIFILEHLARYKNDVHSDEPQPWATTTEGMLNTLRNWVPSSILYKYLNHLYAANLIERNSCWTSDSPQHRAAVSTYRSRINCYQVTDRGRLLLDGYRSVYEKELEMAVGQR